MPSSACEVLPTSSACTSTSTKWCGRTSELVEISARLRSERERSGRRLNTADAWIAATAIMLGCPLASHDGDFLDIPNLALVRMPSS